MYLRRNNVFLPKCSIYVAPNHFQTVSSGRNDCMYLNGQKCKTKTYLLQRFMWILRKHIRTASLDLLAQVHNTVLFFFPCICVYVTGSVSFVSKSLFTRLPVINYGKQVFLKYTGASFNSCPDTSRQDIDDSFNVRSKQETDLKYIVVSHNLHLIPPIKKKRTEIIK